MLNSERELGNPFDICKGKACLLSQVDKKTLNAGILIEIFFCG
jgi:hypothetical protein